MEVGRKPGFTEVKRCPKCGSLSLSYVSGRLLCSKCGFGQDVNGI
ncbi:MAG TPA: hypothetical protein VJH97_01780 [Candidatus Nanoarchaeia archaeon]|nr:hypothetical protein [Candidatus Nanoarchaeia archaeon]